MDKIDHIFLINLDKREDRLAEFMGEIEKVNLDTDKFERFPAIYRPDLPSLGCTLSHLEVIKIAKERGYQNILIFEDDFTFLVNKHEFNSRLSNFFDKNLDFKVLMLSYYIYDTHPATKYDELISSISYAAFASGYIVNQSCYDELIEHLSYGAKMLELTSEHWNYINDQIWRLSQENGGWFIFNEKIGTQRESFSDVRGIYFCPDKENYESTYDGFTYYHIDPVFHESICAGMSEPYPKDLKIIKKYLKMFPHKNRGYLDIGGHIGTTVMPFMKTYNECIVYEPETTNYNFLCQNIKQNREALGNKRVIPKQLGVSDSSTTGSSMLHGSNSGCYYFKEDATNGNVKTIRLDDDEDVAKMDIDFIKIDTEGSELSVLKGGVNTLMRTKPLIQVETNGLCEQNFGVKQKELFDFLFGLGAIIFDDSVKDSNTYFYFPNETLCIVPRTIFCFWTGSNPMSETRHLCLETIKNYKLITPINLLDYILQSNPLHPSYSYLSDVHKADYLRTYFMHFYGGGYADIKVQTSPWDECFLKMESGNYYACGYKEIGPNCVPNTSVMDKWENLIGNGSYIFKPNTEFTSKWYNEMIRYLDDMLPLLEKNPARWARDCIEHDPDTTYPIEWSRMLGYIFHPINYEFHQKVLQMLPEPLFYDYL